MAYDELLADRVRDIFKKKRVHYVEKNMFGGLCFMVDDKMCCGPLYDKKKEMDVLMCRIGEDAYNDAIARGGSLPMDFTGRPMKGYVFVTPEGFDTNEDLEYWIQLCIDFNPLAKASRKRKK